MLRRRSRERPSCLIIISSKENSYILKILLRFGDDLIKIYEGGL